VLGTVNLNTSTQFINSAEGMGFEPMVPCDTEV
jgi:hypothetical protein